MDILKTKLAVWDIKRIEKSQIFDFIENMKIGLPYKSLCSPDILHIYVNICLKWRLVTRPFIFLDMSFIICLISKI